MQRGSRGERNMDGIAPGAAPSYVVGMETTHIPATEGQSVAQGRRPANAVGDEAPRYQQIFAALRDSIAQGHYRIGDNLPTEVELCEQFGVSRYTVREALRRLVEHGMLARRQGSGSEVISAEPGQGFVHHVRSLADLFQYALDTHLDIGSIQEVDLTPEVAPRVGGSPGSRWLLIKSVRRTEPGGEAICVTHSYIPQRLAWIRPEIPGCVGPLYALLEKRTGEPIVEAIQEIQAVALGPEIAASLESHPSAYAMCLLRRYASSKGTLIASFNWHPADDFTYRMQLSRSGR